MLDESPPTNLSAHTSPISPDQPVPPPNPATGKLFLKISHDKIMNLRPRRSSSYASGSEYHVSEKSVNMDDAGDDDQPEEPAPEPEKMVTRHGRKTLKVTYAESSENDGEDEDEEAIPPASDLFDVDDNKVRRVTRQTARRNVIRDEDDEDESPPNHGRKKKESDLDGFIVQDEDDGFTGPATRSRLSRTRSGNAPPPLTQKEKEAKERQKQRAQRSQRLTRRAASRAEQKSEQDFEPDHSSSPGSADADGSIDDVAQSSDLEMEPEPEPEPDPEDEGDGKPYALRRRKDINYAIPPPLEDLVKPPPRQGGGKNGRSSGGGGKGRPRLGWSASGKELTKWMDGPGRGDDSDSDYPTRTPRKPFGGIAPFGAGAVAGGGMIGDLAAGGTPSNLGKIGDSALADADPLGVNQNVTFDEVGGLDDHIHALKEMTLLPLLYPEVFQRFNVTPPRGVLFHGPPGTGKTLLARALAASCRTGGRQISFFMRKGADCLSKWVGEAERQLRLLFEEARNSQPSIIFFDEIDGLAPVRSSKQDQIHASIVSTLLALMDGMDGRGQVVVIGATNRPDAVDSALRRPGRFDREFYFGLPTLDAREKILTIMTRKWEGWGINEEEMGPEAEEKKREVKEKIRGLAKLTKGYGGADLRALCTEAALNAIQRRYPQVYKSNNRLLLKPETIGVGLRDFMISIKKLVPSSARSSSSAASPLPVQFVPLLDGTLQKVKDVIQRVMPVEKKLSALEEAEFEDEGGEEGALEKEMLSQAMQTLRIYRPRVVIHGPVGMGQGYIGAAVLHHLEGYHVQSLELGTLMSDSTRTVEAAIVQLFVEAKRNQPSVIYIPSLVGWCAAVSETSRSTVRAMLDTLAPTDPILLLAVVDGRFSDLPKDVRAWFGPTKDNRVALTMPSADEREAFFEGLLADIQRPPNRFADGMERKKRKLEELEEAPPVEPRKPTPAELALQEESDMKILTLLKYRLGPILTELRRKFKRFTKKASEEYGFDPTDDRKVYLEPITVPVEVSRDRGINGVIDITGEQGDQPFMDNDRMEGIADTQQQVLQQAKFLYNTDLDRMMTDLYKGYYLTPQDFLDEVGKMVHNANMYEQIDVDRLHKAQAMFTAAEVSIQEFDPQLRQECERMAGRERQRREEHKREKEKEKGKDKEVNGHGPPAGARRSARNNGLEPEHSITDPVKLERRLKRQRGEESSGADSHGSEGETANGMVNNVNANNVNGERDAKRSRIIDDQDDDRDPLDTLGSSRPGSELRPHQVRFAQTEPIEPMRPLLPESNGYNFNSYQQLPMNSHPSLPPLNHVNHVNHIQYPQPYSPQYPQHHQVDMNMNMNIDMTPRRQGGFDPSLLNPAPQDVYGIHGHSGHFSSRPNDMPLFPRDENDVFSTPSNQSMSHLSIPNSSMSNSSMQNLSVPNPSLSNQPQYPFSLTQMLQEASLPQESQLPPTQLQPPHQRVASRSPAPSMQVSYSAGSERVSTPTPIPVASSSARLLTPEPPKPEPMVIERTPTPLPEFHVSSSLLSDLRRLLKESTTDLNIEQLEQLRATSLGTVWRHRKEWVRDGLVEQLLKDVKDFIADVREDSDLDD
ncbi:putative AAA domain-containing protein C31G5.19 [Psilocybe cubensis]|uniref:AAA domain-containing protein C31G5.19 n=2 Tax=Psilocybe cubensis TaxID=181762 RepID=A0ACB8H6B9_PSICU|nr:putative AAA domain-containing protein C31G5.19 [Psilocybe cubensis]KAH9483269.1 putative AAA domain-containing protein C31G5.19 [Psilocybe cubensis]